MANATRWPAWQARTRESDGQVGLAGARRAQEDGVLLGGDEVQCAQMGDDVARQAAQVVEVEFLEGLDRGEAGGADAALAAVAVAGGDLALQAGDQVLVVGPGFGLGALGQAFGGVQQGGRLHRAGEEGQVALQVRPSGVRSVGRGSAAVGHGACLPPGIGVVLSAPPSMRVNMRS